MTDHPSKTPPEADRKRRLAEALRANLKRRKSQTRARRDPSADAPDADPSEAASLAPSPADPDPDPKR